MMSHSELPAFLPYSPETYLKGAEIYLLWLELVPPPNSWAEMEQLKTELDVLKRKWYGLKSHSTNTDIWHKQCQALAEAAARLIESMDKLWMRGIA